MAEKRKDTKGRILRDREYQQADGRYYYRYYDHKNVLRTVVNLKIEYKKHSQPVKNR